MPTGILDKFPALLNYGVGGFGLSICLLAFWLFQKESKNARETQRSFLELTSCLLLVR